MIEYLKIKDGEYQGKTIDQVPIDYLVWFFPKMQRMKKDYPMYLNILNFFLTKNIRIKLINKTYYFYLIDYPIILPNGNELHFMFSCHKLINSKGENVYEINFMNTHIYVILEAQKYCLGTNYVSYKYIYGGVTMVYEKNPDYYFKDDHDRIIRGAFLMRKPYIPNDMLTKEFSNNFKIK